MLILKILILKNLVKIAKNAKKSFFECGKKTQKWQKMTKKFDKKCQKVEKNAKNFVKKI